MYKAMYENEYGRFTCQSDSFVDQDGEYITNFSKKQDAIFVASEWASKFNEKVRVYKWIKSARCWEDLGLDF